MEDSSAGLVFFWDDDVARAKHVARIIADCRAQLVPIHRLEKTRRAHCAEAAVIAAGNRSDARPHGGEALQLAASCGIPALAYADGLPQWSAVERCQVLLLGATVLLDSAADDFPCVLTKELAALLHEQAKAAEEQATLKRQFAELGLIAESGAMLDLFRLILRLARLSDVPVLITGESGTGKELLARSIHSLDPRRRDGPFVAVNCAAISPGLIESEMFGHSRGAFTGADRGRKGLIRAASRGVLFLDEISEMGLELQAKMLRVLQDGLVTAVGEETAIRSDARVIAATNKDLAGMVAEGRFRADLFHRLNVVPMRVPPLRERPDDLEPLVRHFVAKHAELTNAPGALDKDFIAALRRLELRGNARQLENIVRHALVRKLDDKPLGLADLPVQVWQEVCVRHAARSDRAADASTEPAAGADFYGILSSHGWNLSESVSHCEQQIIHAALERTKGNQTKAAELLGITPRSMYNKLRRFHI
jgi:two-component system nitrogen regulation response regulator GlnG